MLLVLLTGFLLGFVGSMPVAGPIAVLVLSRGLSGRHQSGMAIALGAALAESAYAYLAFWGMSRLIARYPWFVPVSRGLGSALLIAVGAAMLVHRKRGRAKAALHRPHGASFALGFTVTALNPTLIATWTASVTALIASGLVRFSAGNALPFALGVCAGIASWFAVMLRLLLRFEHRVSERGVRRAVQLAGIALIALGAGFLIRLAIA